MEFMKKVEEISKIVGNTASNTYNTVADKSGKLIEETKLKFSISDKENQIEKVYEEIGKTVYDMYKNGEDVGKVFTKECKKIDKYNTEISDMNTKILYNKGVRVCPECGEMISVESAFCQNCGAKQKPVKVKEEKKSTKKAEEKPEDKVCPKCGQICEGKAKFCAKCGYSFEK